MRARPRSTAGARVRRRCASSAAPSPCIARWRAACARLVGTPASLSLRERLERQRGRARHAAGRGRHRHQRPAQPRLHHRRRPAGQGDHQVPDGGLQALRSRRPGSEADRGARPPGADGDHRRRVLDGGRDREAPRPAGGLPQAPRGAGGGRLARHRRARRDRARHGGALRGAWATWTSSPPRWARRSAARPAGSSAASAAVCDYLTQRARPQLFSNALPPTVAASSLASIEYLEAHPERVTRLREQARYFRERLLELGFKPLPGETPIIPVILGRDRGRHPDERPAPGRRGLRDRLRLPGRAAGPGPRALPDLRRAHQGRSRPGARRLRQDRATARPRLVRPIHSRGKSLPAIEFSGWRLSRSGGKSVGDEIGCCVAIGGPTVQEIAHSVLAPLGPPLAPASLSTGGEASRGVSASNTAPSRYLRPCSPSPPALSSTVPAF